MDEEELRTKIDAGVYHEQKIVLRNRAWLGNFLLVVGLLTCWTIVGLWVVARDQDERRGERATEDP